MPGPVGPDRGLGLLRVSSSAQRLSPGRRGQQLERGWGRMHHTFSRCLSQCEPGRLWTCSQKM